MATIVVKYQLKNDFLLFFYAIKEVVKIKNKMPCEVYSRVVGYFRPVNNWNVGKKQEYSERVEFVETKI